MNSGIGLDIQLGWLNPNSSMGISILCSVHIQVVFLLVLRQVRLTEQALASNEFSSPMI